MVFTPRKNVRCCLPCGDAKSHAQGIKAEFFPQYLLLRTIPLVFSCLFVRKQGGRSENKPCARERLLICCILCDLRVYSRLGEIPLSAYMVSFSCCLT